MKYAIVFTQTAVYTKFVEAESLAAAEKVADAMDQTFDEDDAGSDHYDITSRTWAVVPA